MVAAHELARQSDTAPDPWRAGWRINGPATFRLDAEGEQRPVATASAGATTSAGATAPRIDTVVVGDLVHVDVTGRSIPFRIAAPPDVDRAARAAAAHAHEGGPLDVVAPMPGTVQDIHVAVGAAVDAGSPIVTLEAMKMEHAVAAPLAGLVTELLVHPTDRVARGDLLAVIDPG
jgi:biotin carboxyl carrier protein